MGGLAIESMPFFGHVTPLKQIDVSPDFVLKFSNNNSTSKNYEKLRAGVDQRIYISIEMDMMPKEIWYRGSKLVFSLFSTL